MSRSGVNTLFHHLDERRDAPAFFIGSEQRSFGEIDDRGRTYAAGLKSLGIAKGDRVVTILDSSLELVEVLVGHHRLGAVHVPVNTRYRRAEIEHIVSDAAPKAIVVGAEMAAREILGQLELPDSVEALIVIGAKNLREGELAFVDILADRPLQELPALSDDDRAIFIYTSGTTGPSKGVEHTYGSVVAGIEALTRHWQWTVDDRLVLALPLFHVHGLCIGVHGTLICGNQTEIHRRFNPDEVAQSVGNGGTIFMGVPTMHTQMVEAMEVDKTLAEAMSQARLITSGSAALRTDVFKGYEELTGHRILERYGMSETMLTISNHYEGERRPGAVGFAVPGTEIRIVDEQDQPVDTGDVGEVQVRGPSVMRGYWRLPQKTAAAFTDDGFFRTGDVARRDEDGFIYIVGRRSVDIIKSGGFKISAREIEDVLREHSGVREIGVVGVPDETWGERIAAAIVPEAGVDCSEEIWLDELRERAEGTLAEYKRVRQVVIYADELPRNALGKIQKHRILAALEGQ